jgi:hypothetical protein
MPSLTDSGPHPSDVFNLLPLNTPVTVSTAHSNSSLPSLFRLISCPFLLRATPIKGPITPPPSSFAPLRNRRRASEKFLAGKRPVPQPNRSLAVKSVSPSLWFPSPSRYLSSAHPLTQIFGSKPQQIDGPVHTRSANCQGQSPVASLLHVWKKTSMRRTLSPSPHPDAPRPPLLLRQGPWNRHRRRPPRSNVATVPSPATPPLEP